MTTIKFGTDGWRGIIGKEFTTENLIRISQATIKWLINKTKNPKVVIAYDYRFNGKLFSETIAKIFANNNIKVFYNPYPTSTPALSNGVIFFKADLGIMVTASHNPPEYSGYKLKGNYGGPLLEENLKEIEVLIPQSSDINIDTIKLNDLINKGLIEYVDLDTIYINRLKDNFDLKKINNWTKQIAFNAMFGSAQNFIKKLFPNHIHFNCTSDPYFNHVPPEPIQKNITDFIEFIKKNNVFIGLIFDGDADRIALVDSNGNYIDSHNILLFLIYYLAHYKNLKGKVVTGFSSSSKIAKLCKIYSLPLEHVKIGFKEICKIALKEDILVGGEESGGITIKGNIPERDGIWIGLTILDALISQNKNINHFLNEIYDLVGKFYYSRVDIHIDDSKRRLINEFLKNKNLSHINNEKISKIETLDGTKFYLNDEEWVLIRLSGTESLVRIYSEANSLAKLQNIISFTTNIIENLK